MQPIRHVAVLIETSREYGRGLLRGVARFHQENPQWSVYFQQQDLGATLPRWMKSWQGDGVLARVTDMKTAKGLLATNVPLIDLRGATRSLGIPQFGICSKNVAKHAFEHLAACGLKHFAFVGEPPGQHQYDDDRRNTFVELVQEQGSVCHRFTNRSGHRTTKGWEEYQQQLASWLSKLRRDVLP